MQATDPTSTFALGPGAARLALASLLVAVALAVWPSASVAGCPSADVSDLSNCGPTFTSPNWTDAGGWTDPSKYGTIQLADVNGDGRDELIGRNDAGLEIFWFDTTLGQWRPQVDGNGYRQVLTDFASPPPTNEGDPCSMRNPWYFSTLRAADIDGRPGEEILARFCDGMRVFQYQPSTGQNIDDGTWKRIATQGPFTDAEDYGSPTLYPTIGVAPFRVGRFPPEGTAVSALFARQLSNPGQPSMAIYVWRNGAWSRVPDPNAIEGVITGFSTQECGTPACLYGLKAAALSVKDTAGLPGRLNDIIGRNKYGISAFELNPLSGWTRLKGSSNGALKSGPFADVAGGPDCPFSASGAKGSGSADCLGTSALYFATLRAADIDGGGDQELVAHTSDGARVYKWTPADGFTRLPTLGASVAPSLLTRGNWKTPGQWLSLQPADIDGNGRDELLALDGKALSAWTYDPASKAWSKMPSATPLALAQDPWTTNPSYWGTIRTGDVDGDGREDVVARGPYGIRTFFYDRRKTGGWERYLPDGYQDYPTAGQNAAFAALTTLAKSKSVIARTASSVRDSWAQENAPQASDLTTLNAGITSIANCTGAVPGNPPSFTTCTPPDGSSGFTAADWKTVINQTLAEIYAATQVVAFFTALTDLRQEIFIAQGAILPAIGQDLGLQAAAGTPATYNVTALWSAIFGILGTFTSFANPLVGAALATESYVLSALPSASSTASSSFTTTYGGLQTQFAQMVTEIDKSLIVQSQLVREDPGLLQLVSQLRTNGSLDFDKVGIQSAANQGFATWIYKTLVPLLYDRYKVTNCYDGYGYEGKCSSGVTAGLGVVGGGQNFTALGPNYVNDSYPCWDDFWNPNVCSYSKLPDDFVNKIWGPLSEECNYVPGKSSTAWTFGKCSAGVDPKSSITNNTWGFGTHSGNFTVYYQQDCPPGTATQCAGDDARATAAQVKSEPPVALGRRGHGKRRAVRSKANLRATAVIPPRLRLRDATVRLDRLLYEHGGLGELTRLTRKRAARPLALEPDGAGRFTATAAGRPRVRVELRRTGPRGRVAVTLQIGGVHFQTPRACHALPETTAVRTPPFEAETRLLVSDGRTRHRILVPHRLGCRRHPHGHMSHLERRSSPRSELRPGLDLKVRGPSSVLEGQTVRYTARVRNRRRGTGRVLRSLWDLTVLSRGEQTRIRELRAGRTRDITFSRTVPRTGRRRFCVEVVATAPGAREAHAAACSPVRGARASPDPG